MNTPTALVTGANKGIGRHIAQQLAALGHTVLIGSRDPERGAEAAAAIGPNAHPLLLDVTDPSSIAAAAATTDHLDVLINNAGISDEGATAEETTPETLRRVYETNVFAVVAVTNAFLPALRRSSAPRIVNISSGTASLTASADPAGMGAYRGAAAAYRSAKTALNALTALYAQSLGDPFKVNALAPGLRATDLNARAAELGGDPAEGAAGAVRLALLDQDGPTGGFHSWDGTPLPW
ncbi:MULTISPECIES: SDR family NAD(P)-dependent oxidoreductase [Actinosynnema]|uniref:SDR family NAD(P)-dependent oxidoreductase n=1 Tax=Actinosynnema TaxID=40566 RepID=UPI0020A49E5D|nr:SDR family NAD(P)-dependent oxidoreductase [Actinosynnema pretiosum]MCP2092638.1 Short-chain dehydrogenase [Actinosynnema pretiosum]